LNPARARTRVKRGLGARRGGRRRPQAHSAAERAHGRGQVGRAGVAQVVEEGVFQV